MMVMLRAKHGRILLVVLRRPRGGVRPVPPISIVVELSGSFMRGRLRRLWGRHVYGCGEGAPVVPVGVAIRVIVLVYGCGLTRAGVVALLTLLLGKNTGNVSSTHVAMVGDVHVTRGLELARFLLSFRAYGRDFFLVIVLVPLVNLPRVGTGKVTWTPVVRFAVVLVLIE